MTITSWNTAHNYGMAILAILFTVYPSVYPFVIFAIFSFTMLWIIRWKDIMNLKPPGGYPNYVTMFRLAGTISVVLISASLENIVISSIMMLLVILDGLDGYLARRFHHGTDFGSIFDMETDAFFVCIVSCLLLKKEMVPEWILVPAFIKYFFTVAMHVTSLEKMAEKKTKFGAAIAAIMFISLSVAFILPDKMRYFTLLVAGSLICISFAVSFIRILKTGNHGPGFNVRGKIDPSAH